MKTTESRTYNEIKTRTHGSVSIITLASANNSNMLTRQMIEEVLQFLKSKEAVSSCRIIVIENEGLHFCAGTDLNWFREGNTLTKQQNISEAKLLFTFFEKLYFFPKPIIALVNGHVAGSGIGIMACSDLVIAHEGISLSFPDVSMGMIPAAFAPFVAKKSGTAFTRRMLLTGEEFTPHQALQAGLITDLVETGQMEARLNHLINLILRNAPRTTQLTKQMLNHFEDHHEIDDLMSVFCTKLTAISRSSDEAQEGINAWLDQRKAGWTPK